MVNYSSYQVLHADDPEVFCSGGRKGGLVTLVFDVTVDMFCKEFGDVAVLGSEYSVSATQIKVSLKESSSNVDDSPFVSEQAWLIDGGLSLQSGLVITV